MKRRGWWLLLAILLIAGIGAGYASDDAGLKWADMSEGQAWQFGVAALSIAPDTAGTIWLAAYERGGLYLSTDGGEIWNRRNQEFQEMVPLTVLALPGGTVYAGTYTGLFRLESDEKWKEVSGLPSLPAYAIAASDGTTLCVGFESVGAFSSRDGGDSWQAIGPANATALSLAIDDDGRIYIGTAERGLWVVPKHAEPARPIDLPAEAETLHVPKVVAGADGSLYAMVNGRLWRRDSKADQWQQLGPSDVELFTFALSPTHAAVIYLAGRGLWVSRDAGRQWEPAGESLHKTEVICLEAGPKEPDEVYLGTLWHGAHKSVDAGRSWHAMGSGVGKRLVNSIAPDPRHSGHVYVGTLDGVYRTTDGGVHWSLVTESAGRLFVQAVAVDQDNPDRVYAGAHDGLYISSDAGQSWQRATEELGAVTIFTIDIRDGVVYAGCWGQNILRSNDDGATWASIHNGLETLSVYALAFDPNDSNTLYAGTVEAIYKSSGRGASWQRLEVGMPASITTFSLVVDPHNPSVVYAGTTRGVYRSMDHGMTWTLTSPDVGDVTVNVLLVDPHELDTIYAGAEHDGLYRSDDAGETWDKIGLGQTSVYALYFDEDTHQLWAGTDAGLFAAVVE